MLAQNVVHLDPAAAVFEAMLEGWRRQQSARFLRAGTIGARLRLIRRLEAFSGLYPWQWAPADGEAFIDHLRSTTVEAVSTARSYEIDISLFMEYLLDPRYGWAGVCADQFGDVPQAIFHEGNSIQHKLDYEGDPRRRPLSYDEIQALFDAADARSGTIQGRGVKGALGAARDAAVLKTIYAFGLRRTEASRLDLVDLRRNSQAPQFGGFGVVMVRYGKAPKGAPPKRRTVLLVPEMDWVVETLDQWLTEIRPRFSPPDRHPALWVTERGGRLSPRSINEAFVAARDDARLDRSLNLHCLRHSAVTHWTEFGYPARFVQEQVGHAHASTTSIYTHVSNEYRNKLLKASLMGRLGDHWDGAPT
ncbi:tyrosine-type recombinase/integrase [Mycobacterium avium]|uniref:tyrosine-type recombinase/integrase n=1 Tax=Mycobacterium avium TaxID=1764 RepID=UPI000213AEC8|nr:tyrosine-type recombinase/integrase [Mycobacterium avium]AZP83647.1 site-specific integrase [Mycobacterium avium subsp. paratuberculosis]QPM73621.1 tyrosine-type recombinase/integrase [Mycobacterium avium subsp. paratuberculosis S397]QQK52354.1 tyrosine-type recombinase/integrase [Mycobacterium avium subsp. paratuberculosis]WAI56633.1 tyrosine-type recombinase/integrase [Mycobacterium avium subsp. paratuberculosis]WPS78582.1 tyrosine-type recombinase/integrase [Mycobacterium avium subsp. pa